MLADLVEQQTTTTGTGTYTVSGSVTGRRTFADALATNDVVPYVCTDDAGAFESGLGTWDDIGTLARTVVMASSNAGAAVSWAAGTKRIYVTPHAGVNALAQQKHNLSAAAAPTVNDDAADGYRPGSLWTASYAITGGYAYGTYICYSASVGAAVWVKVSEVQGNYTYQPLLAKAVTLGTGADNWLQSAVNIGGFRAQAADAMYAFASGHLLVQSANTTNATPTNMGRDGNAADNDLYVDMASTLVITGIVSANDGAGNRKGWKVEAVASTNVAGNTTTIDAVTATELYKAGSAMAWGLTVVTPGTNKVALEVTGAAATNIIWGATLLIQHAGKHA